MQPLNDHLLQIHLLEYEKLKDEQIQRIQFRDNMIFVQLGAVGGVASFVLTNPAHSYTLLVIPWVCIVLGWTYISNDRVISALGEYMRGELDSRLQSIVGEPAQTLRWEWFHRVDKYRSLRKVIQLIVDLLAFCISGIVSIGWLYGNSKQLSGLTMTFMIVEFLLLSALAHQFLVHSDRRVDKKSDVPIRQA